MGARRPRLPRLLSLPLFSCLAFDRVFYPTTLGKAIKENLLEDSIGSLESVKLSRESCGFDRLIYTVGAAPLEQIPVACLPTGGSRKIKCTLLACLCL